MASKTRTWTVIPAIVFLGAVALGAVGCGGGGGGGGPVIVDPGPVIPIVPADDHGDSRDDATALALNGSLAGEIDSRIGTEFGDDEDYFRLDVTEPGTLTIYTTGFLNSVGELQAGDGAILATDHYRGTDTNFKIEQYVGPGTYYVKVSGYTYEDAPGSTVTYSGAYDVHADFVAHSEPDPGDTLSDPTVIALGASVSGAMETDDDRDYFRVEVTEPGTLTVYTTGNTDTIGELWNADRDFLVRNNDAGTGTNFSIEFVVDPGTYYVIISSYYLGNYVLHTRFVAGLGPPPDDHGNSRADATVLAIGSSVRGVLAAADRDYFRIEVSDPGELVVYTNIDFSGGSDHIGELQAADGALLASDNSDNFLLIRHPVNPGTYYVWIGSFLAHPGVYTGTGGYELHAGLDIHGNYRTNATELPLGGSLSGEIRPPIDLDLFRMEVTEAGVLTVYTTGSTSTAGKLQAADGTLLASDLSSGTARNFQMVYDVTPGTYYISVGSAGLDSGNYVVHADFVAGSIDDHGNSRADATVLALNSSLPGTLETINDTDFFRVDVTEPGTLTVYTASGDIFSLGELQAEDGAFLATEEHFNGRRHAIEYDVTSGTYYVKVSSRGMSIGDYDVHARFVAGTVDDHGDSRADATLLVLNGSLSGMLETFNDVDLFRVEVAESGTLTVWTRGQLNTLGELQDGNGAVLASDLDSGPGQNFWIDYDVTPGTYYVSVRGSRSDSRIHTGTGNYIVLTRFVAGTVDDHGDSQADATVLPLNSSLPGTLESFNDTDFFRVDVTEPGQLTVRRVRSPNTALKLELQARDGSVLTSDDDDLHPNNFSLQSDVAPGTYYVRVRGDGSATGTYEIDAHFVASTFDDHGDSRASATLLALGDTVPGEIEKWDDVDYFRIDVTLPGTLTVYTSGSLNTVGELQAGDRSVLATDDDGGDGHNFRIKHDIPPGTYYIRIASRSYSSATGNYEVHASFRALPPDHSDTPEQAQEVVAGQMVEGYIDSPTDVDYFRVVLSETSTIDATIDAEPGVELAILDADGNVLAAAVTSSRGRVTLTTVAGDYSLRVLDKNRRSGPFAAYNIVVSEIKKVADNLTSAINVIRGIHNYTVHAGGASVTLDLRDYFSGPEETLGPLTFRASASVGNLTVEVERSTYKISAAHGVTPGPVTVKVYASIPGLAEAVIIHTVTIEPENQPPLPGRGDLFDQTITSYRAPGESFTYPLRGYFRDETPDQLTFSHTVVDQRGAEWFISSAGGELTVLSTVNMEDGDFTIIIVTATDPEGLTGTQRFHVLLTVGPRLKAERPPLDIFIPWGGERTITLTDYIEDPEGGQLAFAHGPVPADFGVTQSGPELTVIAPSYTASIMEVVRAQIAVIATDASGRSKEFFPFDILVTGPRLITGADPLAVSLRPDGIDSILLTEHIEDPLGGSLTFVRRSTPSGFRVIETGARWNIEARADTEPGEYVITVIATESNNLSVEFPLQVSVEGPRRIPGGPALSVAVPPGEATTIRLTNYIEDYPSGSLLNFSYGSLPTGLNATLTGSDWTIRVSPDVQEGEHVVTVTATNGAGVTSTFDFQVTVGFGPEWIKASNVDCYAHIGSLRALLLWRDDEHAPFTYSGACSERRAHGQGIATLSITGAGDARYDGEWRYGKVTGHGIAIYPNGDNYEGDFVNGLPKGQGTAIYPDGSRYAGEWDGGLRRGEGTWTHPNGTELQGSWYNNVLTDGRGILIHYRGSFEILDQRNVDFYRIPIGSLFAGAWINHRFCSGEICYPNDGTIIYYANCTIVQVSHGSCPVPFP